MMRVHLLTKAGVLSQTIFGSQIEAADPLLASILLFLLLILKRLDLALTHCFTILVVYFE